MTSSTHQSPSTPGLSSHGIAQVNPLPRLLMGPGPINADPRVLRAMSAQLLGQFDPQFRGFMKQAMVMYREVFETRNEWTLIVDGTARSAQWVHDVYTRATGVGAEERDEHFVDGFGGEIELRVRVESKPGGEVELGVPFLAD